MGAISQEQHQSGWFEAQLKGLRRLHALIGASEMVRGSEVQVSVRTPIPSIVLQSERALFGAACSVSMLICL